MVRLQLDLRSTQQELQRVSASASQSQIQMAAIEEAREKEVAAFRLQAEQEHLLASQAVENMNSFRDQLQELQTVSQNREASFVSSSSRPFCFLFLVVVPRVVCLEIALI